MKPEIELIHYAIENELIDALDYDYAFNRLQTVLGWPMPYTPYEKDATPAQSVDTLLNPILNKALETGKIPRDTTQERDLFEAYLMDVFTPHPSAIQNRFESLERVSSEKATNDFYHRSKKSNYIKTSRIAKNLFYTVKSSYGDLHITINKSKPEKDPKAIATKKHKEDAYPQCLLCKENVGYYGHLSHPGRSNHRVIKVMLNQEPFYFQYSPYVYYNEHAIVFHENHIPMKITEKTFKRLFDFVDRFPHYFLGSNAALPIVGGSILNHEHYQGGRADFPIDHAQSFHKETYKAMSFELLNWPLSVLRIKGTKREALLDIAESFRRYFMNHGDESLNLIAKTDTHHNALTPILRKHPDESYTLLLALRNNRTSKAYPDGIFHPHPDKHHIKKENIGLIEVMGLAILPARLETAFDEIEQYLKGEKKTFEGIEPHKDWIQQTLEKKTGSDSLETLIRQEAGKVFIEALEDCGLYKQNASDKKKFKALLKGFLQWHSN